VGVEAEAADDDGQKPPVTVIEPPVIGCDALISPMVPATVMLPPLLVPPQAGHYALEFFDFAARQTTHVTILERPSPTSFISALTVSPDERWVLYAQRDKIDFDLMLVENFR
jgi:hypothetical protein